MYATSCFVFYIDIQIAVSDYVDYVARFSSLVDYIIPEQVVHEMKVNNYCFTLSESQHKTIKTKDVGGIAVEPPLVQLWD